ncbi:unnamed protein product, partial [Choristocarpus tenellus]
LGTVKILNYEVCLNSFLCNVFNCLRSAFFFWYYHIVRQFFLLNLECRRINLHFSNSRVTIAIPYLLLIDKTFCIFGSGCSSDKGRLPLRRPAHNCCIGMGCIIEQVSCHPRITTV